MPNRTEYDVIIIGGGITGAGTARDCAMRGLKVLLLERFDYTHGATGRNHGLLHSGARYAVSDRESARECIQENAILRRIASGCVEDTSGLFVELDGDDPEYADLLMEGCSASGIPARMMSAQEALALEPSVNPSLRRAVQVPDGAVDPFRLTMANLLDARSHGAVVRNYEQVTDYVWESGRIVGVITTPRYGSRNEYRAKVVVNASGIWGQKMAQLAGVKVSMYPAKGALLIFGHRVNNVVLNRCRKPSDADILVPGDTISLLGTTSSRVDYDTIDHMEVMPEEVDCLLDGGSELVPELSRTRILRAYCGVRPLVAADDDPTGRGISRGIVLLDHSVRDHLDGLITITGGKLMTYRLMAEKATDLVMKKLGLSSPCRTHLEALPGSRPFDKDGRDSVTQSRYGEMSRRIGAMNRVDRSLLCECEHVSQGEVRFALDELDVQDLVSLRRRTRLGMGTCQGGLCACRASAMMAGMGKISASAAKDDLRNFLRERWKGVRPIAWGQSLRESQYFLWMYRGLAGLDELDSDSELNS